MNLELTELKSSNSLITSTMSTFVCSKLARIAQIRPQLMQPYMLLQTYRPF